METKKPDKIPGVSQKKRINKYLKYLPFYILSIIPISILYLLSDFMYFVIYYLIRYRRNVVRTNLKNSFPNKKKNEIIEIEKKFYKHLCDVAVETIKALTISRKSIEKRFHVKNKELIEELYDQKKDLILYMAHFGNWEWLSFLPLYVPYQSQTFYQQLSNRYFDEFMLILRSRHGTNCVESHKGYKTMIKLKQKGILSISGILGDQSPVKQSPKCWVNFLNQETAFINSTEIIAKKLNEEVVYVSFEKLERGKYEVEFVLLKDALSQNKNEKITYLYAKALENSIIKTPELWLWSHRRWKLSKPKEKSSNNSMKIKSPESTKEKVSV